MKASIIWATAFTLTLLCAGPAGAKPEYLDVLTSTYKAQSAQFQTRSCSNCHVSDSDFTRNPYGKLVGMALAQAGTKDLSPAILHQIENQALPGSGRTILASIDAGAAPADTSTGGRSGAAASAVGPPPAQKSWFPDYAFHPAVVHFPIALFVAGVVLDALGLLRRQRALLLAGWFNLLFAAVTSLAGLASGYTALRLMHVPFAGIIRQHILTAVAATVIMWVLVALRVHRHEKMSPQLRTLYYVLAAAGLLLVSYAGHLGGEFVYGG